MQSKMDISESTGAVVPIEVVVRGGCVQKKIKAKGKGAHGALCTVSDRRVHRGSLQWNLRW